MKKVLYILLVLMPVLFVCVPAALVTYFGSPGHVLQPPLSKGSAVLQETQKIQVKVYRTEKKVIETIPLERYIEGVVAAEMPAEFEMEALKAQALAARTYMIKRLQDGKFDDVPKGAYVLDTISHQAYLDEQQRKKNWGEQYSWKNSRIKQAVKETAGIVLTYKGAPIDATFFSTSNGFTENAQEYWDKPIPYLKSVASPWDVQSPRYETKTAIAVSELERRLGIQLDLQATNQGRWYQVLERTTGNRIGRIRIGGKVFSGREIREKLSLYSSAFTMELKQQQVLITTRGYGHGVGMSQWGANGMAKSGRNAEQIVKHYYQGISLQTYKKPQISG